MFSPGEICSESGIYRVTHYRHRVPHHVLIRKGVPFPTCSRCTAQVRFELLKSVEFNRSERRRDPDFPELMSEA